MIICRVKQNGYDTHFKKLYTLDLVVVYRLRENKVAEVWLMSDSLLDYFAQSDRSFQIPKEKLSMEEIEKRDFNLMLEDMHKHDGKTYIQLTSREQECLFYFLKGFSTKEIAKKLNISYRTIEDYLASVRRKYHCKNKLELREKILLV